MISGLLRAHQGSRLDIFAQSVSANDSNKYSLESKYFGVYATNQWQQFPRPVLLGSSAQEHAANVEGERLKADEI